MKNRHNSALILSYTYLLTSLQVIAPEKICEGHASKTEKKAEKQGKAALADEKRAQLSEVKQKNLNLFQRQTKPKHDTHSYANSGKQHRSLSHR